jgi:hypothetical protein
MRETCTSGSVRDGDGNVPIYSAIYLAHLDDELSEGRRRREIGEIAEEAERAGVEGGLQAFEKQPSIKAREHPHG